MNTNEPSVEPTPASIIDKVRKLLAKAERTDNPHEAEAFSQKAAQMIAANRLDLTRLRTNDAAIGVWPITLGRGPYARARLALLRSVARANGCEIITSCGHYGTTAHLVGAATDLDAVELLYTSLHAQAANAMTRVRRTYNGATKRARRTFLFGFADEVGRMLDETRVAAEQAVPADSLVPALRRQDQRVEDFIQSQFGPLTRAPRARLTTLDGWDEGKSAASRSDLGRKSMDATGAIDSAA